ncbi:MAG TPA: hypothetical protein VNM47_12780 [Terriglobia bacterium]|nr:hypothetical protein [Terriglobia bacterium]
MKTVRSLLVSISVLVMFLGLAATGAKAQSLKQTHFAGKFTLPFMIQWGGMILPPGDYNLYIGYLTLSGPRMVEVANEDMGIQRGFVLPVASESRKATQSVLVCVVEGGRGYVRSLEIAELGQSIGFARPHGVSVQAWIVGSNKSHNVNTQLAETRIPVVPRK